MQYFPQNVPTDPADLPQFISNELQSIANALSQSNQLLLLAKSYSAPAKPREGMIALADGTSWNPGRGAGYYGYQNGAWSFLSYVAPPAQVDMTPAGIIAYFPTATAPAGYLKANGAAVSRTTYAALFSVIGVTYGAGDGSTTFNVPDLRGYFSRNLDDGRGVDPGRAIGSAQGHALGYHSHLLRNMTNGDFANYATGGGLGGWGMAPTANNDGAARLKAGDEGGSSSYQAGSFAAETRPSNIALLACIKF